MSISKSTKYPSTGIMMLYLSYQLWQSEWHHLFFCYTSQLQWKISQWRNTIKYISMQCTICRHTVSQQTSLKQNMHTVVAESLGKTLIPAGSSFFLPCTLQAESPLTDVIITAHQRQNYSSASFCQNWN